MCWSSSHPEIHPEYDQQFDFSDLRFWQTADEIHFVRLGLCDNVQDLLQRTLKMNYDQRQSVKCAPKPALMCSQ